jgi:hypothetical protein
MSLITPDQFAELAWRVLFLKGRPFPNRWRPRGSPDWIENKPMWQYLDGFILIADSATREYLTVAEMPGDRVLLSKKKDIYDTFFPSPLAVEHLKKLTILETLADL